MSSRAEGEAEELADGQCRKEEDVARVAPEEAPWLLAEAVEPFKAPPAHPFRRAAVAARHESVAPADADGDLGGEARLVAGDPDVLLHRAEADEQDVRGRRGDAGEHFFVGPAGFFSPVKRVIVGCGEQACTVPGDRLDPVREILDHEDYARSSSKRTRLVKAKLGNDAGIIGAALLGKE